LISFRLRLFRALPPVIGIVDGVSHIHLYEHAILQAVDNYLAKLRESGSAQRLDEHRCNYQHRASFAGNRNDAFRRC
jgi:hypothetical protein